MLILNQQHNGQISTDFIGADTFSCSQSDAEEALEKSGRSIGRTTVDSAHVCFLIFRGLETVVRETLDTTQ